jgi:hypothetical protein
LDVSVQRIVEVGFQGALLSVAPRESVKVRPSSSTSSSPFSSLPSVAPFSKGRTEEDGPPRVAEEDLLRVRVRSGLTPSLHDPDTNRNSGKSIGCQQDFKML